MSKDNVMTIRIDNALREQIERCAREDHSAVAEEVIRHYCERRHLQRLRERDVEKALEAFRRYRGSVSHGSLAQNIDEELYGPMR